MSLPVNLIVKNVKVDKFAFIQSINLEKNEEKEFINRFMSKFEKAYSSLMGSIQKEEEEDSEDDIDQQKEFENNMDLTQLDPDESQLGDKNF